MMPNPTPSPTLMEVDRRAWKTMIFLKGPPVHLHFQEATFSVTGHLSGVRKLAGATKEMPQESAPRFSSLFGSAEPPATF